jgi:hypothetical protein
MRQDSQSAVKWLLVGRFFASYLMLIAALSVLLAAAQTGARTTV